MKKKKKPKKKKPPIPNPDPSGLKSTPNLNFGFTTTDVADRLNIYAPRGGTSVWRTAKFDVSQDKVGIYVGNYSLSSIFRNAGLPVNATILPSQFKSIRGSIGSFLTIDSSDRFIYNRVTGDLFFDPDGSGVQPRIGLIKFTDDTKPSLTYRNILTFTGLSTVPGSNNLMGGPGNDILMGEAGPDQLMGDLGNDTLIGGNGTDQLLGNAGDDTLSGGLGDDGVPLGFPIRAGLLGGEGNDFLKGEAGNDSLFGEADNDVLRGGTGEDILEGGDGDDRLNGEENDDRLFGGSGIDFVQGGVGNDRMDGGEGDDTLIGGKGQDSFVGGLGNDILNGGKGNDIFILERGGGRDIIQDYKDDQDWLGLPQNPNRSKEFLRFNDLTISQQGSDTLIRLGAEELAVLRNTRANQIRPADFVAIPNFVSEISIAVV